MNDFDDLQFVPVPKARADTILTAFLHADNCGKELPVCRLIPKS